MLDNGASIEGMMKNTKINIILYAILKEQFEAVEMMLEANDHKWPDLSTSANDIKE